MSHPFTTGMKFTVPRNFGYQMARVSLSFSTRRLEDR
jgi:hypothetical protein